jgi:hypothetical protein
MARRAQAGAYKPVKTALCVPIPLSEDGVEDLARGVELLTDRVVDIHPCRPSVAHPFAHYALWILGSISPRKMRSVQRLLSELRARSRAPAHR